MAAATAVFDTYELLEHILLQLPATSITKCSRVSSTWRLLIRNSSRIREAHTLHPKASREYPSVMYESREPIKFKPMLPARTTPIPGPGGPINFLHMLRSRNTLPGPSKSVKIDFFVPFRILRNDPRRPEYEDEYISNPPISHLRIGYSVYPLKPSNVYREHDNECVLRNPKGITMGELLDTAYTIEETERKYNGAASRPFGKGSADVGFATAWIQLTRL